MGSAFDRLLAREKLPDSYARLYENAVLPCANVLAKLRYRSARTLIIGLNGTQGSGKSTLAKFLALALEEGHDLRVAILSLDDIYLTKTERKRLADDVHPLLATRGVPGTHDIALGHAILGLLMTAGPDSRTPIPHFDKARDDRAPEPAWPVFTGRPNIVLLEGWCAGSPPEDEADLQAPLNALERDCDPDGRWRHHVNAQLGVAMRSFLPGLMRS